MPYLNPYPNDTIMELVCELLPSFSTASRDKAKSTRRPLMATPAPRLYWPFHCACCRRTW